MRVAKDSGQSIAQSVFENRTLLDHIINDKTVAEAIRRWSSNPVQVTHWIEELDLTDIIRTVVWNALDYLIKNGRLPASRQLEIYKSISSQKDQPMSSIEYRMDNTADIIENLQKHIDDLRTELLALKTEYLGARGQKSVWDLELEAKRIKASSSQNLFPFGIVVIPEDHLDRGQVEFDRYVVQHPDLNLGSWISIVDDNPQTLRVFGTYQQACQAHMAHDLWFIAQYLGRGTPYPRIEEIITCPFGLKDIDGDHFLYSYADAEITDPRFPNISRRDSRMMIDTGAMVSLGTADVLQYYRAVRRNQIQGVGGTMQITYVNAKIVLRDTPMIRGQVLLNGRSLDPVYAQIGYPERPKRGEQWILGQNILSMFRHNWITNDRVKIEFPVLDPVRQGPAVGN